MMPDIDPALLRSFIAITEAGSFAAAADLRNRSQPALSLQIKRLESTLGTRLFHREGRRVRLTRDGAAFEHHARRILELHDDAVSTFRNHAITGTVRIGMIQDLADALTSDVLARFAHSHAGVHLEMCVDQSAHMATAFESGALDIVLSPLPPAGAELTVLGHERLRWLAAADSTVYLGEAIRLVCCDEHCAYRRMATSALDTVGLRWSMAMTSPSLAGVLTAVRAGIGITIRGESVIEDGLIALSAKVGLPDLPSVTYYLAKRAKPDQPAVDALARMVTENFAVARAHAQRTVRPTPGAAPSSS